jgi:histidinol-phosphate aminotransferase
LRLYSDPHANALCETASRVTGFARSGILAGNGSDELLAMIVRALVEPGEMIAYPYPSYVLYETLAQAQGAVIRIFPFDREFRIPPELFGCGAKVVFVTTPNSPSGTSYNAPTLRRLAESLVNGVLVIDEAYVDFARMDALALASELPNVLVTRTLSKSHSLAGMRIGLLFGPDSLVAGISKVKDSYNLDRLAIVAGAAALEDTEWMRRNVDRIRATRERMTTALTSLGLEVVPSEANFVFARLSGARVAKKAYQALKERGILVRYFDRPMLDDGLRITVGTDSEVDALLETLRQILRKPSAPGSR